MRNEYVTGGVHSLPHDIFVMISTSHVVAQVWENITPLAKNEWICWIQSAKKSETRAKRIRITKEQLLAGKRRPCCWPGCPHRGSKKS